MPRTISLVLVLALVLMVVAACVQSQPTAQPQGGAKAQPAQSQAQPIVLKAVTFLPSDHPLMWGSLQFFEMVNQKAKGELKIEYLGGPEVIPANDQVEAMKTAGAVHIVSTITTNTDPIVPESTMIIMRKGSPVDARKSGIYDAFSKLYQDAGLYYLGDTFWPTPFYFWLNKPVTSYKEMSKLRLRTGGLYEPFIRALGSTPVTIAMPDVYTALDRGMVDGFGWGGLRGVIDSGWHEVSKNVIDHPFWSANGVMVLSMETWNKLPKHLQDIMIESMKEIEEKAIAYNEQIEKEAREKATAAGVKFIKFSDAEAKEYIDIANKAAWEDMEKRARPEPFKKMKELLTK